MEWIESLFFFKFCNYDIIKGYLRNKKKKLGSNYFYIIKLLFSVFVSLDDWNNIEIVVELFVEW